MKWPILLLNGLVALVICVSIWSGITGDTSRLWSALVAFALPVLTIAAFFRPNFTVLYFAAVAFNVFIFASAAFVLVRFFMGKTNPDTNYLIVAGLMFLLGFSNFLSVARARGRAK
jgi:hypothetical protein